ncbi:MAG: hypothetical protein NW214_13295 [Pseudanabaenaceae cyanobacterium bins.39]|nr:hypothetical protein [Pseudanabaenaceae cyanobacterium bins.39]
MPTLLKQALTEVTPMTNSLEVLFCHVDDFCQIFEPNLNQNGDNYCWLVDYNDVRNGDRNNLYRN